MMNKQNSEVVVIVLADMIYPSSYMNDYANVAIDLKTLTQKKCLALLKKTLEEVKGVEEIVKDIEYTYQFISQLNEEEYELLIDLMDRQTVLHNYHVTLNIESLS
ncbi:MULTISPECIES: hypothetical protein [unclassified Granulicatella]|uniref:hypothetical protein n=1 Tax=unclassified Granulicatella TaxID=2630493 RepID=UPI001073A04F|nr:MULTISPECIES: hypothetical protein [unclassified Granulicatella]MBF0780590.1 hypothetical protein [Granulicatella sp. 19428wC4_WM01]TFU94618.1 hypothetical protein E4T68_05705 [Granulicatella sp. WM01]